MAGRLAADIAYYITAGTAFTVVVPLFRRLAVKAGAVSRPNPNIPAHRQTVPLLGGTALVATYAALVVAYRLSGGPPLGEQAAAQLGGVLAFTALGTVDDFRPLRPGRKVAWQTAICGSYLLASGRDDPVSVLVGLAVLLAVVNAYNLVDVMDGLLGLLAVVAVVGLLLHPSMTYAARSRHLVLLMGLLTVLWFNRPRARLFFGDAGSLPLGFLIGAEWLQIGSDGGVAGAAAATGLVAVPLLETALVVAARLQHHQSPLLTSPDHFALRLQEQMHWSQYRVLAATGGAAIFWGLAPLLSSTGSVPTAVHAAASATLAVLLWSLCWAIPPSWDDPRHSPRFGRSREGPRTTTPARHRWAAWD